MHLQQVRQDLNGHLNKINSDRDWSFILNQVGMFSFTGLNKVRRATHTPAMVATAVLFLGRCAFMGGRQERVIQPV